MKDRRRPESQVFDREIPFRVAGEPAWRAVPPAGCRLAHEVYTTRHMNWSRREFPFLLPALAAAQTSAPDAKLSSKAYRYEDLTARQGSVSVSRQILKGQTHAGWPIDVHETELSAGAAPHPPHHHLHEEVVFLRDGQLEVTIMGEITRVGPGSVVYFASNQEHGFRNTGTTAAHYFVLALGTDS
jgi:mannose-6-phosphate isomerase-like protein (cupin superfamily)